MAPTQKLMRHVLVLCLSLSASFSAASVHFSLMGSFSENYMLLMQQISRSASASIAVDLGTYFRIGLTHRQGVNDSKGFTKVDGSDHHEYHQEHTNMTANSIDFTIILYYGQIFVPYLQVGIVKKDYQITSIDQNNEAAPTVHISMLPEPYGGLGLGIRINNNFTLKLSYSVSRGYRQMTPIHQIERVLDSHTSVGISYNL